jgi:hypothetical protein
MTRQLEAVEIIQPGPAQVAVRGIEAGRLDEVDSNPEARGHPHHRPGILGDVGLIQREAKHALPQRRGPMEGVGPRWLGSGLRTV